MNFPSLIVYCFSSVYILSATDLLMSKDKSFLCPEPHGFGLHRSFGDFSVVVTACCFSYFLKFIVQISEISVLKLAW